MSKRNPFEKYLTAEDHLQHQIITWLRWQHPTLKYHHSPDAGKRTLFEQFKYKYLGSDSGFPDLHFPAIETVIELKVKPNRPTEKQREWLDYFEKIGWSSNVAYTFEEAVNIINSRVTILSNGQLH